MQCLPQYNAENSVTNRLAKQLKNAKAVSVYILDQCSSAINNSSSSAFRLRSAQRNSTLRRLSRLKRMSNSRRISQNPTDRCRSLLILEMSNTTLVQALRTTKMSIFHFHEQSFASYDEIVDFKRFSRLFRTDLLLRSCLYDASNSRYLRSKFPFRTVIRLDDFTQRRLLPNDERSA